MKIITRIVMLVVALSLVAAACGDDNDSGSDTTSAGGGRSTSITVGASEFAFDPDSWSVAADTPFSVAFTNTGTVEHTFTVLSESISTEGDYNEGIALFILGSAAAESASGSLAGLAPGTYQVICSIPGHFSAGMFGELVVQG